VAERQKPRGHIDPKVTLAHYRGVMAALEDAKAMKGGRGGGGKPPKKGGCLSMIILPIAVMMIILIAQTVRDVI